MKRIIATAASGNEAFLNRIRTAPKHVPRAANTLCVLQNEQALFKLSDSLFEYCGSEDATTCVIIVVIGNGYCYVAHCDSSVVNETFFMAFEKCTAQRTTKAQVYLAGAYDDGNAALQHVYSKLAAYELCMEVKLAFCERINRDEQGAPRTRALAVHLPTRTPLPCCFPNRGPQVPRRMASRSFLQGMQHVYDADKHSFVLPAFTIPPMNKLAIEFYHRLVLQAEQDPESFLLNTSTSPEHESDLFVKDIQASCMFILQHAHNGAQLAELTYNTLENGTWKA